MQGTSFFFTDFGFKRLFGSEPHKELLIDFLNELLRDYEKPIRTLTFKKSEYLGGTELDRRAIFDLYCESEDGSKFIVELQKASQKFFKDRSVFYSTFPIQEQAARGEWNYQLQHVYTVGILNFVFDEDKDDPDKFIYHVKLSDIHTNRIFYDKLTYVYLEMPKFQKKEAELETRFDKWLYAIKNISELDTIPESLKEEIFERFFELAEIAQLSGNDLDAYEKSLKYLRDMHNVIHTAEDKGWHKGLEHGRAEGLAKGLAKGMEKGLAKGMEKGLAKGMEKGMAEGEKNKAIAIARNLLDLLPPETIAAKTGLTVAEIKALKVETGSE